MCKWDLQNVLMPKSCDLFAPKILKDENSSTFQNPGLVRGFHSEEAEWERSGCSPHGHAGCLRQQQVGAMRLYQLLMALLVTDESLLHYKAPKQYLTCKK